MRRVAALIVVLLLAGAAAFAQQTAGRSVYVKTIPIAKIYPHPLGYRILYFRSTLDYAEMYVPLSWFTWGGTGKAAVVWGDSAEFPYLSIYYLDGKFDRIMLYLQPNMHHVPWGKLPAGFDLTARFNVQEPPRDF